MGKTNASVPSKCWTQLKIINILSSMLSFLSTFILTKKLTNKSWFTHEVMETWSNWMLSDTYIYASTDSNWNIFLFEKVSISFILWKTIISI